MDINVNSNLGNVAIAPAPIFEVDGVAIASPISYENIENQRRLEHESGN